MSYPTKITTCCYCGARAALVLRGKTRHELSCSSCGAPIHMMKRLAREPVARGAPETPHRAVSHKKPPKFFSKPEKRKRPKRSKRKSALAWFLDEAKDALEDIFD